MTKKIDANYYKNLPKKRMGAGALIQNEKKEILIVKPSYRDHWSLPGGVVDENESPKAACIREVSEEVGLALKEVIFLGVAYYKNGHDNKGEALQFMFFGGMLDEHLIEKIKVDGKEIVEYKFLPEEKALPLLNPQLSKRLERCLDALETNTFVYLED